MQYQVRSILMQKKKGGNLTYCGLGNNVNSLAHITEKSEKDFR